MPDRSVGAIDVDPGPRCEVHVHGSRPAVGCPTRRTIHDPRVLIDAINALALVLEEPTPQRRAQDDMARMDAGGIPRGLLELAFVGEVEPAGCARRPGLEP